MMKELFLISILLGLSAAYAACPYASSSCGKKGCCNKKVTMSPVVKAKSSGQKMANKTAENNGKIGIPRVTEGPTSFLGVAFGTPWQLPEGAKPSLREIPFTPEKPFRQFERYFVRLAGGRVSEVILEHNCGSKFAAEAEAAVCQDIMREKYDCAFEGKGTRAKATCCSVRRSQEQKTKGRFERVPVMEIAFSTRGEGVLRITARTLNKNLFTSGIKAKSKADLDAL